LRSATAATLPLTCRVCGRAGLPRVGDDLSIAPKDLCDSHASRWLAFYDEEFEDDACTLLPGGYERATERLLAEGDISNAASKILPSYYATANDAGIAVGDRYTADYEWEDVASGETVAVEAIVPAGVGSKFGPAQTWEAVYYRAGGKLVPDSPYYFLCNFTRA
jgi:hypothetical protein